MPRIPLLDRFIGVDREPALPPIESASPAIDGIDHETLVQSLDTMKALVRHLPTQDPWTANDHPRVDFTVADTPE